MTTRSVSHVDHVGQCIGRVNRSSSQFPVLGSHRSQAGIQAGRAFWRWLRFGAEIFEQELLLAAQKAHLEPAEDVIHDRLGEANVGIGGPSAGLEAGMREFLTEDL